MTHSTPAHPDDDLLWQQLKTIPAFRALLRSVESRFFRQVGLIGPVLDVGCGDGHFAQMTFTQPLAVGIDPWWGPLQKARNTGMYNQVLQGFGDKLPFPNHTFGSAISNSVLEHIPDVQPVLNEISRVLQVNGRLLITMPSHNFSQNLGGAAFFTGLGLPGMADRYRHFFNRISRHAHTDRAEVWADRLAQAGFAVERWQYYFSPEALRALEWGHVQGLPSAVLHKLTGHWILAPWRSSLRRTEAWVRPFYNEEAPANGAYIFFIARKVADGPIEARLPAARPFSMADLAPTAEPTAEVVPSFLGEASTISPAGATSKPAPDQPASPPEAKPTLTDQTGEPGIGANLVRGGLTLLALIFAFLGQQNLRQEEPGWGSLLVQLGLSGIFLLLLLRIQPEGNGRAEFSFRLPALPAVAPRRLLLAPALVLSLLAYSSAEKALLLLAFLLWLTAIGIALVALWPATSGEVSLSPPSRAESRQDNLTAMALFIGALLLRTINLDRMPFILNGTESVQGLEALRLAQSGALFSSSQGAPALPFLLLSWPVQWFGPSVTSLRLLSPLIGAITVVVVYWVGQRLWGRSTGLAAAILLLGSYWHLHYSRQGLTVIWEPLLALLALGLVGIALQQRAEERDNRLTWLGAGTAVGLSVYFVREAFLLPLILLALFWLVRKTWRGQGRIILSAGLLSLIIALPQLMHQRTLPVSPWQQSSVLYSQNNWLAQEAARSGQTETAVLQRQLLRGLQAFHARPDNSPAFRAQAGLLGFGMGLLAIIGLITAVFQLQHPRTLLLLLWFAGVLLVEAVLLPNPPQSDRLLLATPALALLAAGGLQNLVGWQITRPSQDHPGENRLVLYAALVVAVLLAISETWYYFGRYPAENSFADKNTEVAHRIAQYLNTLDDTWTVYFYGPPYMYVDFPTITFLAPRFQKGSNLFDVDIDPDAALSPPSTPNMLFLFLPERAPEAQEMQMIYPGGQFLSFGGSFANPLFYSLVVGPIGQPHN